MRGARSLILLVAVCALQGCAITDNFAPRVYDGNEGTYSATQQEALLNIARASRYSSLNYMAVTQFAGDQTESLNVGLPNLTLGPAQTIAQRQFTFGGNSLNSQLKGSFQSNPLVASQFREGMLSPVSSRIFTLLLRNQPREVVFHLLIDEIRLTKNGITDLYKNEPLDNRNSAKAEGYCTEQFTRSGEEGGVRFGNAGWMLGEDSNCRYTKFVRMVDLFLLRGVTSQFVESDQKDKDGKPIVKTDLCFDIGLVMPKYKADTSSEPRLCGRSGNRPLKLDGFQIGAVSNVSVDLVLRSPNAIYRALGKMLRTGSFSLVRYKGLDLESLPTEPYLNIRTDTLVDCAVRAPFEGLLYCIPGQQSANTLVIIDILQELRNLNTSPTDLNSAFTVRLG